MEGGNLSGKEFQEGWGFTIPLVDMGAVLVGKPFTHSEVLWLLGGAGFWHRASKVLRPQVNGVK